MSLRLPRSAVACKSSIICGIQFPFESGPLAQLVAASVMIPPKPQPSPPLSLRSVLGGTSQSGHSSLIMELVRLLPAAVASIRPCPASLGRSFRFMNTQPYPGHRCEHRAHPFAPLHDLLQTPREGERRREKKNLVAPIILSRMYVGLTQCMVTFHERQQVSQPQGVQRLFSFYATN